MRLGIVTSLLSITVLGASLAASGPTFWTTAAPADFLKGTSDGVLINLNGTLTAGPLLTSRLTSTPAQVWSLAEAADGALWAGTGGDGRVIRLRAGQAEQTMFTAPEANIFALAVAGTRVYAASSPDGKVYAIESDGSSRTFFDPQEKYIWALSVDTAGRLWVGAGDPAVIYRVDSNGVSQMVYHPPAAHVVTFGRDASGRLLAGTESPGRLYRLDANDKPFVILDAGAAELRAVASDASGVLYAAAVLGGSDDSNSGEETASVSVATATTTATGRGATTTTTTTSASRRSALYRIEANGTWEAIWQTSDVIYDLSAQADGLLVATGPAGRLYKVGRNRDVQLLTGVDAKQITRFATSARTPAVSQLATANPGRVLSLGPGEQTPASYVSAVRDTRSAATWGLIRWEGTAGVQLATRSGNTETPDDSWSAWSTPYTRREGEPVTSPVARFMQWRATFTKAATPGAQLTGVTVAYLTANGRPVVTSITVSPPGVVFQRPFANEEGAIAGLDDAVANARRAPGDTGPATPAPGRRMFQRGLQTIAWKADDPDDDDRLTFSLEYRREGTDVWRPLKSGLSDTGIYVWDTTSAADGRYIVRVRASDSPSNAADRALEGERESDPIDVDNTPPVVTATVTRQGNASVLSVRVVDARSPIQKVEYSVSGGPWVLLYPIDGLSDSPDERYEIPLTGDLDPSRIVIRATDLLQNTMSQSALATR